MILPKTGKFREFKLSKRTNTAATDVECKLAGADPRVNCTGRCFTTSRFASLRKLSIAAIACSISSPPAPGSGNRAWIVSSDARAAAPTPSFLLAMPSRSPSFHQFCKRLI